MQAEGPAVFETGAIVTTKEIVASISSL